MNNSEPATQAALNLQSVEEFLQEDYNPEQLAKHLDYLVFDYAHTFAHAKLQNRDFPLQIGILKDLRDLFFKVAKESRKLQKNGKNA